jgi:mRNA interferase MazF
MNDWISTLIVAPMTSKGRAYPSRVECSFEGVSGEVALDQIRSVDKRRIIKVLGSIDKRTQTKVLDILAEMFAP